MGRLCPGWQDRDVATTELLQRSDSDSVIAGVCGGIAQHYRIDPLLVRLAAVIIALSSGVGLVLYGAAWLLLPRGISQPALMRAFPKVAHVRSRTWIVVVTGAALVILVLVGVAFNASLLPTMVVLGILYASQLRSGTKGSAPSGSVAPQTYPSRPSAPTGAQWPLLAPPPGELIITTPAGPWRPTNRFGQPLTAQECAAFYAVADPIGLYERPAVALPVRRSRIIALVSGLAIAALFAMMSLIGAFVTVPAVTYLAVGLVGVGISLVVGAFAGRPRGFIAIAIALVLVAGGVSTSGGTASNSVSQGSPLISDFPSQLSSTGDFDLDLSQVQIDQNKTIDIQVDGGNATLVMPAVGNYTITYDDSSGRVTMPGPTGNSGMYKRIINPKDSTLTISITVTSGNLDVTE
jgi:phage shock protein PspC (stress-responsive transcriptional regulator)